MSMFILRAEEGMPILIADIGRRGEEAIFEEVNEEDVPSKCKINKLGGYAVRHNDYMRSNTGGLTYGKYFIKVAGALDFKPIMEDEFKKLNNKDIKYDLDKAMEILEATDKNNTYIVGFEKNQNDKFNINIIKYLKDEEITVMEHKYKEYAYNFKGMYDFSIEIPFAELNAEQLSRIKEIYGNGKRRIKVSLDGLKEIINKYNLRIYKDNFINSDYFIKTRTNFNGRNSENIFGLYGVMTFKEASERWGLSDSTLRKLVTTDKLKENIDFKKSGSTWLIATNAMWRIYGSPKKENIRA